MCQSECERLIGTVWLRDEKLAGGIGGAHQEEKLVVSQSVSYWVECSVVCVCVRARRFVALIWLIISR